VNYIQRATVAVVAISLIGLVACDNGNPLSPEGSGGEAGASGIQYAKNQTFDEVQSGAHLIARFDAPTALCRRCRRARCGELPTTRFLGQLRL
jgi:hypothetical protein